MRPVLQPRFRVFGVDADNIKRNTLDNPTPPQVFQTAPVYLIDNSCRWLRDMLFDIDPIEESTVLGLVILRPAVFSRPSFHSPML